MGKTTLLKQLADDLLERGWPARNLTYADFEDFRLKRSVEPQEIASLQPPGADPDRPHILLLDEIHGVARWEVSIGLEPVDAEPALLRIRVRPASQEARRPSAYRKGGAWHFLRRVGARTHPMSRQEIFDRAPAEAGGRQFNDAIQEVVRGRRAFQEAGHTGLWIAIRPARTLAIDVQEPELERLVGDPSVSGNRRGGWHFARTFSRPTFGKNSLRWDSTSGLTGETMTTVELLEIGELRFTASLDRLHWKGEDNELWPFAILEYPISAFRIARTLYREHLSAHERVVADLALVGVGGLGLREGTPGDLFFKTNDFRTQDETDLIWEPVVFDFNELNDSPDRCGFRLVRRIYQAFAFRESAIPRQYDRETGQLLLPE